MQRQQIALTKASADLCIIVQLAQLHHFQLCCCISAHKQYLMHKWYAIPTALVENLSASGKAQPAKLWSQAKCHPKS